jgi:hypothetical protein
MRKRGKFHAFAKPPESVKAGETQEIVEREVIGRVTKSFLHAGLAHTLTTEMEEPAHIDEIKAIVRLVPEPNFTDSPGFHWPFDKQESRLFTSKFDRFSQ